VGGWRAAREPIDAPGFRVTEGAACRAVAKMLGERDHGAGGRGGDARCGIPSHRDPWIRVGGHGVCGKGCARAPFHPGAAETNLRGKLHDSDGADIARSGPGASGPEARGCERVGGSWCTEEERCEGGSEGHVGPVGLEGRVEEGP
jgi:hypothetical protein